MVYSYMIAIDFEANRNFEIIEFPAVLIDLETGEIEDEFHRYVLPEYDVWSSFYHNLTGITREDINSADPLIDVLYDFDDWLEYISYEYCLRIPKAPRRFLKYYRGRVNCAFVTWGNDLGTYLETDCTNKNIDQGSYLRRWINLQFIFKRYFRLQQLTSLERALDFFDLNFVGRRHSGLDDARNTAILCNEMYQNGIGIEITNVINYY